MIHFNISGRTQQKAEPVPMLWLVWPWAHHFSLISMLTLFKDCFNESPANVKHHYVLKLLLKLHVLAKESWHHAHCVWRCLWCSRKTLSTMPFVFPACWFGKPVQSIGLSSWSGWIISNGYTTMFHVMLHFVIFAVKKRLLRYQD